MNIDDLMKYETEFKINDDFFYIWSNLLKRATVTEIHIEIKKIHTQIYYIGDQEFDPLTSKDMFRTKEGAAERWLENQGLTCGVNKK